MFAFETKNQIKILKADIGLIFVESFFKNDYWSIKICTGPQDTLKNTHYWHFAVYSRDKNYVAYQTHL